MKNTIQIKQLQDLIISTLTPLIDDECVLLEIPNYKNIGDSLIWKGEQIFLDRINRRPLYESNLFTFKPDYIKDSTIILLQGGGNFGDLYDASQSFRMEIISKYPNNKIILFPQTIFYKNEELMKIHLSKMAEHKYLYLCLRDQISFDTVKPYFDNSRLLLLPDMAFFIDLSDKISNVPTNKNLFFKRNDTELKKEQSMNDFEELGFSEANTDILDWPTYYKSSFLNNLSERLSAIEGRVSKRFKNIPILNHFIDPAFGLKSQENLDAYLNTGVKMINRYDKVVTSRLHGLILSILLDKQIYILDNTYGKNKNFYNTWLTDFEDVSLIND